MIHLCILYVTLLLLPEQGYFDLFFNTAYTIVFLSFTNKFGEKESLLISRTCFHLLWAQRVFPPWTDEISGVIMCETSDLVKQNFNFQVISFQPFCHWPAEIIFTRILQHLPVPSSNHNYIIKTTANSMDHAIWNGYNLIKY